MCHPWISWFHRFNFAFHIIHIILYNEVAFYQQYKSKASSSTLYISNNFRNIVHIKQFSQHCLYHPLTVIKLKRTMINWINIGQNQLQKVPVYTYWYDHQHSYWSKTLTYGDVFPVCTTLTSRALNCIF